MPPLIIDDAKKKVKKKKNFEIEKFNNKKIKKLSKLPKYNIILEEIQLKYVNISIMLNLK